jgi:dihydropyrimidinase
MAHTKANLVIKNGTIVTASDTFTADIAITGDQITAIGQNLSAEQTLDARGLLVMPGGIDPHVHLAYPQGPHQVVSSDDWLTGTVAAAAGGTTTVLDFVEARPHQTWMQAFAERQAQAEAESVIDYGFHMAFNRADEESLKEVRSAIKAGMPSFKIYMAYDGIRLTEPEMLVALDALAAHGGMAIVHAENHFVINYLVGKRLAKGETEPRWHPTTRPAAAEAEATLRALTLAEIAGVRMHIVHVTTAEGARIIDSFRQRGLPVSGEVCIQHLLLTDALYDQPGFEPAKYVMAPPLRSAADTQELWQHLAHSALDFVVTDHCPFTLAQKRGQRRTPEFRRLPEGIAAAAPERPWCTATPPFNQIPGGAPGIETRMPLLYHFGVNQGHLTLNQFVNYTSTAAAQLYGLYPRKGAVAPGADADLILWDPDWQVTLTSADLHQNCDYTPYEGWQVKGWPRVVLSRGDIIVHDGEYVGYMERGKYLRRPL